MTSLDYVLTISISIAVSITANLMTPYIRESPKSIVANWRASRAERLEKRLRRLDWNIENKDRFMLEVLWRLMEMMLCVLLLVSLPFVFTAPFHRFVANVVAGVIIGKGVSFFFGLRQQVQDFLWREKIRREIDRELDRLRASESSQQGV